MEDGSRLFLIQSTKGALGEGGDGGPGIKICIYEEISRAPVMWKIERREYA